MSRCERKEAEDTQPPSVPAGLAINTVSPFELKLAWSPSRDNTVVVEYRVYQGKAMLESVTQPSAYYSGLTPSGTYCFTVSALDAAGNESGKSEEVCTKRAAPRPPPPPPPAPVVIAKKPAPPTAPWLKAKAVAQTQIELTWTASKSELGIAEYKVYKAGSMLTSVKGASATSRGLSPGTTYCYTVTAVDKSETESAPSNEACATTPAAADSSPTVPTGLKAEAVSAAEIKLAWNPSTDDKEVTGYNVYHRGALLKTARAVSEAHSRLTPDTRYCYTVTAFDAVGNESGMSNEACARTLTTRDTEPPGVPAGLTAMAATPTRVEMSWIGSTDNVGVEGYKVYRNDSYHKSVTATSMSTEESNLNIAICYRVSAFDASGNESGKSQQSCVTVKTVGEKGTVWAGGLNDYGQLGDGSTMSRNDLVQVSGLTHAVRIAAGGEHTLALKSDGTVWAWGRNLKGQLGNGNLKDSMAPVQVKGITDVVAIAAGWSHSAALKKDGTVWTWGRNYYGQLGSGTLSDSRVPVQVRGLTDVAAIAVGWYHTLAVKKDGSVWAWGWNLKGQLGDGSTDDSLRPVKVTDISDVVTVTAGQHHSVALKKDGSVWAWGWNDYGQIGNGTIQPDRYMPTEVKGVKGVSAIAAGGGHTAAVKKDGTVWTWGFNDYGQLGDGTTVAKSIPTKIAEISDAKGIAAGMNQTAALKSDGTLWVWGWNLKQRPEKPVPHRFSGLTGISEVAAGMYHIAALKEE
ncbi:MAG: hypothetical protein Q8J64_04770 [Thermodesulfovibrionales bacterium]|nr:hypothetical protein [Thermodesulfovibrionales bacterium]